MTSVGWDGQAWRVVAGASLVDALPVDLVFSLEEAGVRGPRLESGFSGSGTEGGDLLCGRRNQKPWESEKRVVSKCSCTAEPGPLEEKWIRGVCPTSPSPMAGASSPAPHPQPCTLSFALPTTSPESELQDSSGATDLVQRLYPSGLQSPGSSQTGEFYPQWGEWWHSRMPPGAHLSS